MSEDAGIEPRTVATTALAARRSNRSKEKKKKHGALDPMPKLTITSPYVHSRVDSNTFTMGNPMPESTLTFG